MLGDRDLTLILAVANTQSFTRASEYLHISQPALSQAIKKIEAEIGSAIFVRGKNKVQLTLVGQMLVEDGRGILDAMDRLNKKISSVTTFEQESLCIGVSYFYISAVLPRLIQAFLQSYPNSVIKPIEANSGKLEELLLNDVVEISLIPLPLNHPELKYQVLFEETFLFAMHKSSPLRDKLAVDADHELPSISLFETKNESYILSQDVDRSSALWPMIFREYGIKPNVAYLVSSWETIFSFIEKGLGVGFLPDVLLWRTNASEHVTFCRTDRITATRPYVIAYKDYDSLSTSAKNFVELSKTVVLPRQRPSTEEP